MAKQRKKAAAKSAANAVSTEDKFLRLLAMLVVRGIEDKQEQALILSGVGFDASEIADMLRVGNNYVNVAIHRKNTKTKNRAVLAVEKLIVWTSMKVGDKEFKTVFFLGAGATRGAIDHIVLNRKLIKPPLNGDFFKVAETYARAKGKNSAAQQRLSRLQRVFKRDMPSKGLPTMEEAFTLLYIAKDFPEIYNRGPGRRPAAGVRNEITDFVNLLFPILAIIDDENNDETGYDRLALKLTDDDALITLNYDTLLDSALHRRGWDPKIGYAFGNSATDKVNWPVVNQDDQPLRVKLLKLHGSMNWFIRGQTSNLQKIFSSKPVKITKPRSNEISGHIRQIAPPIYGKIFGHSHWENLWTSAFRALCDADVLVVIGCSLIDTDFHLRALLSQVARTRKQKGNKFRYAALVDKSVVVRRKWKTVLKGGFDEAIEYNDFDKFLKFELGV